ncbi:MAG TPA: translation elongation factor Ts [Anaerohalosphaeraceae bacterium]|nr:translation elongation factor Ts [Anaerohalosphaeraceae bacterium]
MAEISASVVMKLRKLSGQGMMDCKKALEETDGDMDKALDLLRKKGLATLAKRADKETSEGRIVRAVSADGKTVALATLCCETDFVANNDDFKAACETLSKCALTVSADQGAEALMDCDCDGKKFSDLMTELVSKTGEKTQVGNYIRYRLAGAGIIGSYVHFNSKVATMLEIEASSEAVGQSLKTIASDIAMHITAINPVALDRSSVDPAVVAREREIAADQVKDKPANMVDKIVDGKMAKFFKDNCLVDQPFVKDDTKTVTQALNDVAKAAGGTAKIKRFVRFEIG